MVLDSSSAASLGCKLTTVDWPFVRFPDSERRCPSRKVLPMGWLFVLICVFFVWRHRPRYGWHQSGNRLGKFAALVLVLQ